MPLLPKEPYERKWLLQLITVILLFVLLLTGVWLYYDFTLKRLEKQKNTIDGNARRYTYYFTHP